MRAVQQPSRTRQFHAEVSELVFLSPRMRRIALRSPEIAEQSWPLGCELAVVLASPDREIRRRYTVRSVADDTLLVDAVLHGHGPGSSWAAGLQVGDPVTFFGPRGELPLPAADWLLALTDESGLPAIGALAEAAGAQGRSIRVLAEISGPDEQYPLPATAEVSWLVRGDAPVGEPDLLAAAVDALEVQPGTGYGYVLGESRAVVSLRDRLDRLGLHRTAVYAKGYWNLNARPTR
jgi:NADPH-dependent ferric siderophore reductase